MEGLEYPGRNQWLGLPAATPKGAVVFGSPRVSKRIGSKRKCISRTVRLRPLRAPIRAVQSCLAYHQFAWLITNSLRLAYNQFAQIRAEWCFFFLQKTCPWRFL
jgi:hypothetical protein